MSPEFQTVFARLKEVIQKHTGNLTVKLDTPDHYGLLAKIGPATLKAWGGKVKSPVMPIAWVVIGKAYVSYHLMGIYMNAALQKTVSKELKARMQGKTCFNFKKVDETLFKELDQLTAQSISSFRKAGYII